MSILKNLKENMEHTLTYSVAYNSRFQMTPIDNTT